MRERERFYMNVSLFFRKLCCRRTFSHRYFETRRRGSRRCYSEEGKQRGPFNKLGSVSMVERLPRPRTSLVGTASRPGETRRIQFAVCAVAFLLAATTAFAESETMVFTKGPRLLNPTPDSITIMWEYTPPKPPPWQRDPTKAHKPEATPDTEGLPSLTETDHIKGSVQYGQSKDLPERTRADKVVEVRYLWRKGPVETVYLFRCKLEGLSPGTRYRYRVETDGRISDVSFFETPPATTDKFTFAAYGNSCFDVPHAEIARLVAKEKPDFIIHTGNMVQDGRHYWQWEDLFFRPIRQTIDHIPFRPAMGYRDWRGSETAGKIFSLLFDLKQDDRFYSFDHGPVHFICLDSCAPLRDEEQIKWLDKDLAASNAPWKIVFTHRPIFNCGGHDPGAGREPYIRAFQKHNVDLHLSGRYRFYQRFFPLHTPDAGPESSVTYLITGAAGWGYDTPLPNSVVAAGVKQRHYMLFTVEGNKLTGEAKDVQGRILDSFSIEKRPDGSYVESYLKRAKDTRSLQILENIPRGHTSQMPSASAPCEVSFRFDLSKIGLKEAIDLKASVAKVSASSYRMDPEEVTASLDPSKNSNELKFGLFARKGVKVTRNGRWLRPRPHIRFDYSTGDAKGTEMTFVEFDER